MIENKIIDILIEINEEIGNYTGNDLFEDGLLDSLNFVDLVAELGDAFGLEIPTKYLKPDYFKNKDVIINTINELLKIK